MESRDVFKKGNELAHELSFSDIELYLKCQACFWLQQLKGVSPPTGPSLQINQGIDLRLKKEADRVRGRSALKLWKTSGLGHVIPFEHEHLECWTDASQCEKGDGYFNHLDEVSNIRLVGSVEDVFINMSTGELHIVSYKINSSDSVSPLIHSKKIVPLQDLSKNCGKRRMDMCVWVLKGKGFEVSDIGYFVSVDFRSNQTEPKDESSHLAGISSDRDASIIAYEADSTWITRTLREIKSLLVNITECPEHTPK